VVGIVPPAEPVVTALVRIGGPQGRCPAEEAGIRIGDRILAINGVPVRTAEEVRRELLRYPNARIEVEVDREGRPLTLHVTTEPLPRYMVGISGIGTTVEALEGAGPAQRAGLREGDVIVAVNGEPVDSLPAIERRCREQPGTVTFAVRRNGDTVDLTVDLPDVVALDGFFDSVLFRSSTRLTWVGQGSPAYRAGMRPGDTIERVAGHDVDTWEDVFMVLASVASREHEIVWSRDGEVFTARLKGEPDSSLSGGHLGITMEWPKTVRKRYGALGAVRRGFADTAETLGEIALTIRGFATRQVSPRTMGGIVTIAYYSYRAARLGITRLIHLTAMISAAVGVMNILPIPVMDGGHLVLLAIEKVRGRRLGERVVGIAQSVGLALLLLLVVYVTWNDILRLLSLR